MNARMQGGRIPRLIALSGLESTSISPHTPRNAVAMSAATQPTETIDQARLQDALRAADPAALLLPRRILRRVIKRHRGLGGLGLCGAAPQELRPAGATNCSASPRRTNSRSPSRRRCRATLCLLQQPYARGAGPRCPRATPCATPGGCCSTCTSTSGSTARSPRRRSASVRRLGQVVFAEVHEVLRQEDLPLRGRRPRRRSGRSSRRSSSNCTTSRRAASPSSSPPSRTPRRSTTDLTRGDRRREDLPRRTRPAGADLPTTRRRASRPPRRPPRPSTATPPRPRRASSACGRRQVARKGNLVRAAH